MQRRLIIILFSIATLLAPIAHSAQSLGAISFEPAGWSVVQQGNKSSLRNGSGALIITQPAPIAGSREQALRDVISATGGKPDWKVLPVMLKAGYDGLLASGFVKASGKRSYITVIGVFQGQDMVSLAMVDVGYKGRNKLKRSFGKLVRTLRIQGWADGRSNASRTDDIAGFYVTVGAKTGASSVGNIQVRTGINGLWLTDGGHIVHSETAMAEDADRYCKNYPRQCGRYQLSNGQLTTTRTATKQLQQLGLFKRQSRTLTREGDDLVLDGTRYRRIAPSSQQKLNGQYRYIQGGSEQRSTSETANAASESIYGFQADGRFFRGRYFAGFNTSGIATNAMTADSGRRPGNYAIENFTLTLTYDDGSVQRKAFFIVDGTPVISGYTYQRIQ